MKLLAGILSVLVLATCASAAVQADPGVTSTSIVLGGTAALSGPESAYYAPVAKGAQAYFAYVNAHGGVYGRKIDYRVVDDAYDPAQTVQATRQLVQEDHVFAIFNSIGTEHMLAVRPFLNQAKVPQLFVGAGSRAFFSQAKQYPWTMGYLPSFYAEGALYGRYIASTSPKARIAVLYENDDYGKDMLDGLKKGLHGKAKIVGTASYELTDSDMSAQIAALKATRADTLALFALPKQVIQAFLAAHKLGWNAALLSERRLDRPVRDERRRREHEQEDDERCDQRRVPQGGDRSAARQGQGREALQGDHEELLLRLRRERTGARLRDGGRIHDGRRAEARGQEPDRAFRSSRPRRISRRPSNPVRPGGCRAEDVAERLHPGRPDAHVPVLRRPLERLRRRRKRQALTLRFLQGSAHPVDEERSDTCERS